MVSNAPPLIWPLMAALILPLAGGCDGDSGGPGFGQGTPGDGIPGATPTPSPTQGAPSETPFPTPVSIRQAEMPL